MTPLYHECCGAQYSVGWPLTKAVQVETLDLRLF